MTGRCWWALAALLWVVAAPAHAHEFRPALVELAEVGVGVFDVSWKVGGVVDDERWVAASMLGEGGASGLEEGLSGRLGDPAAGGDDAHARSEISPILPASCVEAQAARTWFDPDGLRGQVRVDCGADRIDGARVGLRGIEALALDVVVRARWGDGRTFVGVGSGVDATVELPRQHAGTGLWAAWAWLGAEHILIGPDHLLFVLVLLLIVADRWHLLGAITGFTVGHSATLVAATMGWFALPIAPVEALIAASVALLAAESLRAEGERPTLTRRRPGVASACFGLLHGLGFSSVLGELGLPAGGDRVAALLAFNVGVELGQVAFVAVLLAVGAVARTLGEPTERGVRWAAAYGAGAVAMMWVIERTVAIVAT